MGQGRQQTERITSRQAGSVRQAANDQERESTVQVVKQVDTQGKTARKCLARGKQDFALGECLCAAFM